MLKEYHKFFRWLFRLADMSVLTAAWLGAYYLRFHVELIPVIHGEPPLRLYVRMILFILLLWTALFRSFGLYDTMRVISRAREIWKIVQASVVSILVLIVFAYFFSDVLFSLYKFSRVVFFYFFVLSVAGLSVERMVLRTVLRRFRQRGFNLRHVLLVGDGELGRSFSAELVAHPEAGLKVAGFLSRPEPRPGQTVDGVPVLGSYGDVRRVLAEGGIDQVFITLPLSEHDRMEEILGAIDNEMVDIKIIPDFSRFLTLRGSVEEFRGLPIVNLRESPLHGWNVVFKRAMDIVLSLGLIVAFLPVMAVIAAMVKLTSPGPVFYGQERMGMDGRLFAILKFRTMGVEAEKESGAVWARRGDPRRTRLGACLRKFSLDELPQFFNVLRGEMSLVGPRPERPVFIEKFKETVPGYMLRHKTKAGITGWAQINGWRGNTSLEKRIEYDLYYIENWSLMLDLKILSMTLWKGVVSKEAY